MEPIFSGWSDFLANSQPVEGEVPAAYTAVLEQLCDTLAASGSQAIASDPGSAGAGCDCPGSRCQQPAGAAGGLDFLDRARSAESHDANHPSPGHFPVGPVCPARPGLLAARYVHAGGGRRRQRTTALF